MKRIFYSFFISVLLSIISLAQYSPNDFELVKTIFERKFDRNIINAYLQSGENDKIIAALLSISHSNDSTFIKDVINLPSSTELLNYQLFALGNLPRTSASVEFINQVINKNKNDLIVNSAFNALGKLLSKDEIQKIANDYLAGNTTKPITYLLFQAAMRGIKIDNAKNILAMEINSNDEQRILSALITLSRYGGDSSLINKFEEILLSEFSVEYDLEIKKYCLINLSRIKLFPENFDLLKKYVMNSSDVLRIYTAVVGVYYNFKAVEELKNFLLLLGDSNFNVAREAVLAIRNFQLEGELKEFLISEIENILLKIKSEFVKGELLYSYFSLVKERNSIIIKNESTIPLEHYLKIVSNYYQFYENAELTIMDLYFRAVNEREKFLTMNSFIDLLLNKKDSVSYNEFLLNEINAGYASVTGIIIENFSSILLTKNKNIFEEASIEYIRNNYNSPAHVETIITLVKLLKEKNKNLYESIIEICKSSVLYSLKKSLGIVDGIDSNKKELNIFKDVWSYSFQYNSSKIITSKGEIEIKFLPQFAPVSVGNFIYLVKNNFFDRNIFHRVVPGFVIQAGDATKTGYGGPGYDIVSEFSTINFSQGIVGMASAGMDTEGSQWFIMQSSFPHLNGRYSAFAEVKNGIETILSIEQNDLIINIELIP